MNSIFLEVAGLIFVYMTVWYSLSVALKRNDIADIAWGLGFIFIAAFLLMKNPDSAYLKMSTVLVTIWGSRLAWHIFARAIKKPEDYRYAAWRKEWGKNFYLRSYLQVFLLQGFFMFLISTSIISIYYSTATTLTATSLIGIIVWFIGFVFESVGDRQLQEFVRNPTNKGKIITTGLWRYTRHPNYFGEVTQWWGLYLFCLNSANQYIIISPLTITILILFVSGVPMLERKYQGRPDWEEYKNKTSVFIPWFPKK